MQPEISVIMPVYNASKYLREAIESVLNQTFKEFELIILNDSSTDNSAEIIIEYAKKDSRIQFVNQEVNIGPSLLRNLGIEKSKGKFIALLDADDIALPTRFEKQRQVLLENDQIGLCGSWYTLFGEGIKNKVIETIPNPELVKILFLDNNNIGNSTVMLKKEVLGDLRFDLNYVPVEDYELWSRLILKTDFYNIPESLVLYRWHDTNITQTKRENTEKSLKKIKANQFELLDIEVNDSNYETFQDVFELRLKNYSNNVLQVIAAGNLIIEKNKIKNIYNQGLLEDYIEKVAIKSLRKAKNCNFNYYKNIQKEKHLIKKIPFIKRISFLFICLFKLQ